MNGHLKISYLLIVLLISGTYASAQENDTTHRIYGARYEQMPEPDYDVNEYLMRNIDWSKGEVIDPAISKVIIRFVIDTSGSATNITVNARGIDSTLQAEIIRTVSTMPKWKPGKFMGKLAPIHYVLPMTIHFK